MSSKNWKNNLEGHKTTNSLILSDYHKSSSPSHKSNLYTTKNSRELVHPKVQIIHRHSSEEDLNKKGPISYQNLQIKAHTKVEEEYFIRKPSKNSKKTGKSRNHGEKQKQFFTKDKQQISKPFYKNNFLKETSSTQSADTLKVGQRGMPMFVKNKVIKKLGNLCNEYNSKIPTNRHKLKRDSFKIISKLGQGKFGKVFLVKEVETGFILAMKIIQKKKIQQQNLLEQFIRELKIQMFLNHSNIISLYGFFHDQTHFYTLMELGCDGQLLQLISQTKNLNEETISFIIKNLLQAIHYMHSNKILHRDIKPENIVIVMGSLKMCDFGWAVNKTHHADLRNTFCGTPLYLSPQLLNGNKYDEKVDIWAIGVLAYELMVGQSPFQISQHDDLHKIITKEVSFPQNMELSEEFKEFIMAMLTKDPKERMTSKRLLEKEFIRKYSEFETCEQLCK